MRRIYALAIVIAMIVASGCSLAGSNRNTFGVLDSGDEITFKILYFDEGAFISNYGDYITAEYPNVRFEVILIDGRSIDEYIQFVKAEQPDVLYVPGSYFPRLIEEGILQPLDPYIEEDEFDVDNIHPPILEYIRQIGNGEIFALAPSFFHRVLYYNQTLFEKFGIPFPEDHMTWEEVSALAQRFPTDGPAFQRVYGMVLESLPSSYALRNLILTQLGRTYGLEWFDVGRNELILNTASWKPLFETGLTLYSSGTLAMENSSDLFTYGRAAMMLNEYSWIGSQARANQYIQREIPFEWNVVTAPVDPERPAITHDFWIDPLYAVSSLSPDPEAAWDIVKFINSHTFAALSAPTTLFAPTRPDRIRQIDGVAMDTFYKLKPDLTAASQRVQLPESFQEAFTDIFNEEMERVMNNEKSLDQALADLEARGQAELDLALADEQD